MAATKKLPRRRDSGVFCDSFPPEHDAPPPRAPTALQCALYALEALALTATIALAAVGAATLLGLVRVAL
jgi:hypothetical protein